MIRPDYLDYSWREAARAFVGGLMVVGLVALASVLVGIGIAVGTMFATGVCG